MDCVQKLSSSNRSYVQRLMRQEEDREIIKRAERALDHAFNIFNVCMQYPISLQGIN